MTPSEQRHRHHWDLMTQTQRLWHVGVLFSVCPVGEVAWRTFDSFKGHEGWWFVRWYG